MKASQPCATVNWIKTAILISAGTMAYGKPLAVVEGFLVSVSFLPICVVILGIPFGVHFFLKAIVHVFGSSKRQFWTPLTLIGWVMMLMAVPTPGWQPRLAGYYTRVKLSADCPAVIAWANAYPIKQTVEPDTEWRDIPLTEVPVNFRDLGGRVQINSRNRNARFVTGGGMAGALYLSIGDAISCPNGEWRVNKNAVVWESE